MKTFEVTAEQFECHPAGMNSIKESVLYCVGTAPDNYLVWGDVATWVTAGATLLLILGGWLALRATKKQISEAREIAHLQQRNEALTSFAAALRELSALSLEAVDVVDLRRHAMRALTTSEHWALSLPHIFDSRALNRAIDKFEKLISHLQFARTELRDDVRSVQKGKDASRSADGMFIRVEESADRGAPANFLTLSEAIPELQAKIADICFQASAAKITEQEAVEGLEEANARMDALVPNTWRYIANIRDTRK